MTRKKLLTVIVCIVASAAILAAIIYAVQYAIAYVRHPAFSHDDYVHGSKIVIDNETPYEYDSELAVSWPLSANSTLDQVFYIYGNKILREKDGILYTVYSDHDNHLLYTIFTQNENGTWVVKWAPVRSTATSPDFLLEYIYEYDTPQAILGEVLPTKTIDAQTAAQRMESAHNTLYTIRYNLGLTDIRELVADGTYAQAYRMTVEGAFYGLHYIDFYVHHDGYGTLIYKRYNSEGYACFKEIYEDVTYPLSKDETNSLLDVWEEQNYFTSSFPSVHPYEEVDYYVIHGITTYLEGINHVSIYEKYDDVDIYDYHMSRVNETQLIFPEFWAIRDAMVAMVESKGTEVRFNRTSEEEKLRSNQATD